MEKDSNVNVMWDAHQATLKSVFDTLLNTESLADCTVGAEGQHLKAHKLMLSACSQYFELLFRNHCGKHVIVVLPGVRFHILKALMEFMYRGEVLVPQDEIDALLQLADFLQVKGLSYGGSVLSEKKQAHKTKNKLVTSHCLASPGSYEHCESPELLEVSGSRSQSESLQKQDYTKETSISTPTRKRKKNDRNSSREEPPPRRDSSPLTSTVSHTIPPQRSELPDKSKFDCGILSGPSQTSQLPLFIEGNFSGTTAGPELISTKPTNSKVRTSVYSTASEENTILDAFIEPKRENSNDLNEGCIHDVILDSDDTQRQNIGDDTGFVVSELTDTSFCDRESLPQEIQFQQTEWTNTAPREQTSVSNSQFDTTDQTAVSDSRFKCQSCDRSYRHYKDLQRHLKYECGKEPQFQCPHCVFRFRHKHQLKAHMFTHNH